MPRVDYVIDGDRVPGVTTVIGQLAKPALVPAAAKLAAQGRDYRAEWDDSMYAGTYCHHLIATAHFGIEEPTPDVTDEQRDRGAMAFHAWREWWESFCETHMMSVVDIERNCISQSMRVGGTPDFVCELDGKLTLLDWKTASRPRIYPEHAIQVAAYAAIYSEVAGREVEQAMVVSIPSKGSGCVKTSRMWTRAELEPAAQTFAALRMVYESMPSVKGLVK